MRIGRRTLLQTAALAGAVPTAARAQTKADYTIRIAQGLIELSPEHVVSTTLYNGQFPGALLRFKQNQPVVIDTHNDTDSPELVHWHGQTIASDVDGAAEEGSPYIPPHGMQRVSFTPQPAGLRFYHTHTTPGADLSRGLYTGQVGPVYIEPKDNPGAYDQEIFLVLKEFAPSFSHGGDMDMNFLAGTPLPDLQAMGKAADAAAPNKTPGYEVNYDLFSINGRMLGHGEPIRVRSGERVLFHIVNASATETRSLALPGHVFRVVALDGNPVPTQATVPVLWLGTAERISAIVEMRHPGIWVLGDLADDDRKRGMGIVVEYAGHKSKPAWSKPHAYQWDYTIFGTNKAADTPDETIEIAIVKRNAALNGFNQWLLNGKAFDMDAMKPFATLHQGRRYRLKFRNATDDIHPLHLHRHSFELTRIHGKPTAGVIKDVVMLGGFQELECDFTANNPGPTLFHCHEQVHMDFGFAALFDYA